MDVLKIIAVAAAVIFQVHISNGASLGLAVTGAGPEFDPQFKRTQETDASKREDTTLISIRSKDSLKDSDLNSLVPNPVVDGGTKGSPTDQKEPHELYSTQDKSEKDINEAIQTKKSPSIQTDEKHSDGMKQQNEALEYKVGIKQTDDSGGDIREKNTQHAQTVTKEVIEASPNKAHAITSTEFAEVTAAREQTENKLGITEVNPNTFEKPKVEPTPSDIKPKPSEITQDGEVKQQEPTPYKIAEINKGNAETTATKINVLQDEPDNRPLYSAKKIGTGEDEGIHKNILDNLSKGQAPSDIVDNNTEGAQGYESQLSRMSVQEIAQKMADELKIYSNDVAVAWKTKKMKGVGWTAQAASELESYMEKILITQPINPECVKHDLEKHAIRVKALEDAIKSCKTSIKRENWVELQEKTKYALSKVNEIALQFAGEIDRLTKEPEGVAAKEEEIINKTKKKLDDFDIKSVKESLSSLRENALTSDDTEFEQCIDGKPEKAMIEETLQDVMRIKTNCVG